MLKNKKFNIVLSIIIAIGIWAYVIGETNPTDNRTFRDISIQLVNESVLTEQGLAISDVSAGTLNVTVTGTRASINQLSEKDITATVDLSDAAIGDNQLRIVVRVPDNVEVDDQSLNKLTITVEELVSQEVDIVPEYQGTFSTDQEPITVEMNRTKVTVSGAQSLVERVDHIQAVVGQGEVTDKLKTIGCKLQPVDKNGTEIERLNLSASSVQVTAQLASVKTVTLEVPVRDDSDETVEKEVTAPKTITIKGQSRLLENIETVTAQTIDVTDIEEDATVAIVPILPDGVQVSSKSAESLYAEVSVVMLSSKTFRFNSDELELTGLADDLNAEILTDRVEVLLRGTEEQLSAIKKSDITLSIDLTDLEEGNHTVSLKAVCSKDCAGLETDPEEIRVTIE